MKSTVYRLLLPSLCFIVTVLLSGCAAQKSVIILLPDEDGKVSGEVTVANAQGSQVLSRSWQSVEIAGTHGRPASPVVVDKTALQDDIGGVLAAMPLPPAHYLLYFKQGTTELQPDSKLLLPSIIKAIKERHPAQLSVVGHTDTMGTPEFNSQLGLLRARAVLELLTSHSAAPAHAEISSRGNTDLLVKTPDQVPEPRNRRAEITVR